MAYIIVPSVLPSHNDALQARFEGISVAPYMPPGHTIQWRKNGIGIKQGLTDDVYNLSVNTAADKADPIFGAVFTASDTGAVVDFLIDLIPGPLVASHTVTLSNSLPVISGAGVVTDAFNFTLPRPTLVWTYTDGDNDPQFSYRVRFGSSAGAGDYYDTGTVTLNAATTFSVTMPNSSTAIPFGAGYFWTLDVSDGQKVNPFDLSINPPRILVTASGTGIVDTPPVVSNVLVDGVSSGAIHSLTPTISWTYFDIDGQPQAGFHIVVTAGAQTFWDSGVILGIAGAKHQAKYNYNLTGLPLPAHTLVTVSVSVFDDLLFSNPATTTCKASSKPVITTLTVDSKVNPLSVASATPFFNWKYTDIESDPLVAYEIRVAVNSANLGTDSFIGDVWQPGVVITPESYGVRFNADGSAFGCGPPLSLMPGIRYFFQVQIQDAFDTSDWAFGYFQLNAPPTAANLFILPPSPFNSDDLVLSYDFIDDPGSVEDLTKTQIKWFQQPVGGSFVEVVDLRNQRTVPADFTIPGDQWKFSVRPNDGIDYSILTYTSAPVTIIDRPPTASALAILPSQPKTADNLQAIFALSDPDEDPVSATIKWYKNGIEQVALRNEQVISASVTNVDEVWNFTVLPNDGFENGPLATSSKVTILNTQPKITSISIDGALLPTAVKDQNPTIAWTYQDDDMQPQQKFEVIIGTQPARTQKILTNITSRAFSPGSAAIGTALFCNGESGILSTASGNGILISGNDIFDSGVVDSSIMSYKYVTDDSMQNVQMNALAFDNLNGYAVSTDLQSLKLQPGISNGTALGKFNGQTTVYDIALTFTKEQTRRSTYRISVNGTVVGQFISTTGTGSDSHIFNAIRVESGSIIGISGVASDIGAQAAFSTLVFTPVTELDIPAGTFKTLSGYLQDGTGGIKLAGLAGTATTKFSFPSGTYNIELVYVTETNGNPVLTLSLNNSVLLSFAYESGAQTRSRFLTGIPVNTGDTIKISGTRNAGAMARVKEIIFRPTETVKTGSKLRPGIKYYASVRAFDGRDWSDWATTALIPKGSAWVSSVENAVGWTIEARIAVSAPPSNTSTKPTTSS